MPSSNRPSARRTPTSAPSSAPSSRRLATVAAAALVAPLLTVAGPATASHDGTLAEACPAATPEDGFGDLDAGATHETAVDCVVWWGLTQGSEWHRYRPLADVRRDQMASFVARMMRALDGELPADPPDAFDDDEGSPHQHRINQLAAIDVVRGVDADSYGPARPLQRAQAAALLVRAFEQATGATLDAGDDRFDDDEDSVHEDDINAAAAQGWVNGVADGTFAPGRALTRQEMGSLLARVLDTAVEDGHAARPEGFPTLSAPSLSAELVTDAVDDPIFVTAPEGDDRLFIVERAGRVRVLEGDTLTTWLDISDRVSTGGERGLFSIAFPPDWPATEAVFVSYTDPAGHARLARVPATAASADPGGLAVIETELQPASNHNGGLIMFGPDGLLWWGLGDGGGSGDQFGNGQDETTRKGGISRLDVLGSTSRASGNAFPQSDLWAIGLRNPWRFDIDVATGTVVIADVGQNRWEEVSVAPARASGLNFGWPVREGAHCFGSGSCDTSGLTDPIYEYDHDDGCSITGGVVYRGSAIPSLRGHYLFSDFCSGWVRTLRMDADGLVDVTDHPDAGGNGNVLSFGTDAAGEVYLATTQGVYRLVAG